MSDQPRLLPCPFCGGEASNKYCYGGLVACDNRELGAAHCPGSFGCCSEETWNRRDGLLPALRQLRTSFAASRPASLEFSAWALKKDDASLLILAGVPGAMSPGQATSAGSAPAVSDVCMWCGKTHAEHAEYPNSLVSRMPCLGLRVGFQPKQAAEPAERVGVIVRRAEIINHARRGAFTEARKMAQAMLDRLPPAPNPLVGLMVELIDALEARAKAGDPEAPVQEPPERPDPQDLLRQLHEAIYGASWARPDSPHIVWEELIEKVKDWRRAIGNIQAESVMIGRERRFALLDAARDLREWAKDWEWRPVNKLVSWQQQHMVIVQCADRIEARAR